MKFFIKLFKNVFFEEYLLENKVRIKLFDFINLLTRCKSNYFKYHIASAGFLASSKLTFSIIVVTLIGFVVNSSEP